MIHRLWGELRCFFGWHEVPLDAVKYTYAHGFLEYRCTRCQQMDHVVEIATGASYDSYEQFHEERYG